MQQSLRFWRLAAMAALAGLAACGQDSAIRDHVPITSDEAKVGRYGEWMQIAAQSPPLNILLITLDTTRRDYISCYGEHAGLTPYLDSLAARGVIFERGLSPVPITLPSHATVLTGFYPYQHGVRNNGTYTLADRFTTLPEVVKPLGYGTAAIAAAFPVDSRFGLNQGFDHYDDEFPATSIMRRADTAQRRAGDVTRLGLEWLEENGQDPFFLWLHYFDPHYPYDPPEPHRSNHPNDPYAGEVAYMDACIGEALTGLDRLGLRDRTAVLVVGDHGESLGEHGELAHSIFVYNSTQAVPFLLTLPASGPFVASEWRGRRIEDLVNLVDCFPTLLNILGIPGDERPLSAGISLLPVIAGTARGHRWIYHETLVPKLDHNWSDLRSLEYGRWKYILAPNPEIYDVLADPDETRNLYEEKRELADLLDADLKTILRHDPGSSAGQITMDQETIEKLRSLGYLSGSPSAARDQGPLPDPKEMIGVYESINLARSLTADRRPEEALAVTDSILARDPNDVTARRIRAASLVALNRGDEALTEYDLLLQAGGADPATARETLEGWTLAALAAGRLDDALERAQALVESTTPEEPGLYQTMGRIHAARGDEEEARAAFGKAVELSPNDPMALSLLGDFEMSQGRMESAMEAYRQALRLNPSYPDALAGMAEALLQEGKAQAARAYVEETLTADSGHPQANFRLAWFLRQEGRVEDSERQYLKALSLDPRNGIISFNLGNIYLETGRVYEALGMYNQAVQLGPTSQNLYVNLGVAHARTRNLEQAVQAWEAAAAMDPDSPRASEIRKNIEQARQQLEAGTGRR